MNKFKQRGILFGFLTVATMSSVLGAVSGTLAWYAYSTRATVAYSGTSVNNAVQLQIGIASPVEINDFPASAEVEEVQRFEGDPLYYYFAPVGVGLSHEVISTYLETAGYASNSLSALTSGSFNGTLSNGEALDLKSSPQDGTKFSARAANPAHYSQIPFVFRVLLNNEPTSAVDEAHLGEYYSADASLWLTDAKVRASEVEGNEGSKVHEAIRMYMNPNSDKDGSNKGFIYNPTADAEGYTTVGGLLDLTGDEYYDFDEDGEIIYGEYEGMEDEDFLNDKRQAGLTTDSGFVDINGSGVTNRRTTFTAKHKANVDYFNNYNGINFKKAHYVSKNEVYPTRDPITGDFKAEDMAKAICKTDANDHYLARLDMTVYLEGWDFAVVDEEYEHMFDLGLTFEINKVS